jgi:DNA-binding CsgD family transcriptional regulator
VIVTNVTTPSPHHSPLKERTGELAVLEAAVDRVVDGAGGTVVVEGPPGIGKTRLIGAVRDIASARGLRTLSARGSELERDFSFGVVRQLLEPAIFEADDAQRRRWLTGAAALAAPLFEPGAAADGAAGDGGFPQLHGLYWLCANIAGDSPLVAIVDDVQWADAPSTGFLGFVAQRLEGAAMLLVVGSRPPVQASGPDLVALLKEPSAVWVGPSALSPSAVAGLIEESLGEAPAAEFCDACHAVTSGNPFLVGELLRELAAGGIAPTAEQAAAVRRLGPKAISAAVLLRLARLPPAAALLARAVAILGDDVAPEAAAMLAESEPADTASVTQLLVRADVLMPGERLSFVHPVVRSSIYTDISPLERRQAHARAVIVLRALSARPEQRAAHLLLAAAGTVPDALGDLTAAAAEALGRGAPEAAVLYLRRALDEVGPGDARRDLLWQLGRAEKRTHGLAAIEHLEEALRLTSEPERRGQIALDLGLTLVFTEGTERPALMLDEAAREVGARDPDLRDRLLAGMLTSAVVQPSLQPLADERLAEIRSRGADDFDQPGAWMVAAILCYADTRAGRDRATLTSLARAALEELPVDEENSTARMAAAITLIAADELDEVITMWDGAVERGRRRGSILALCAALCFRGAAFLSAGDLPAAESDAREAVEHALAYQVGSEIGITLPPTLSYLGQTLIEQGRLDEAEATLAQFDPAVLGDSSNVHVFIETRARLRLAQGRSREAVTDLLDLGHRFAQVNGRNPAMVPWRSLVAPALHASNPARARALADEEVELAREWGAHRAIGVALRAAAAVRSTPEESLTVLEEAVAVLRDSPARLELAYALCDYGAAQRRANRRSAARPFLSEALQLAQQCGAHRLEARARVELQASGERSKGAAAGSASLTPSERRVAEMAAGRASNRDIAEQLFVTLKTVETHLNHVYTKLDLSSRHELTEALSRHAPDTV